MSHRGQEWRFFQLLKIRWSPLVRYATSDLRGLNAASLIVWVEGGGNRLWEGLDPTFNLFSHLGIYDFISTLTSRLSSVVLRHNII